MVLDSMVGNLPSSTTASSNKVGRIRDGCHARTEVSSETGMNQVCFDPASMLEHLHTQVDIALRRHKQELSRCLEAVALAGASAHRCVRPASPRGPANRGPAAAPVRPGSPPAMARNPTPPDGAPAGLPGMMVSNGSTEQLRLAAKKSFCLANDDSSTPSPRSSSSEQHAAEETTPRKYERKRVWTANMSSHSTLRNASSQGTLRKSDTCVSSSKSSDASQPSQASKQSQPHPSKQRPSVLSIQGELARPRRNSFQESMHLNLGTDSIQTPASVQGRFEWLKAKSKSTTGQRLDRLGRTISMNWFPTRREQARTNRQLQQSPVWQFTRRPAYQGMRALMMVVDVVVMIYETEAAASLVLDHKYDCSAGIRDGTHFIVLADLLCLFFLADLVLRLVASRCDLWRRFNAGRIFNIYVVCTYLAQLYGYHWHPHERSHSSLRVAVNFLCIFRVLRLLQIVQVTTIIRTHSWFRELRIMVFSLIRGVRCLIWSVLIVFVMVVSFGLFFTEGTLAFLIRSGRVAGADAEALQPILLSFGTLDRALLTLFKAMSSGVDWGETFKVLAPLGPTYQAVYVIFVTIAFLGVLNVVTAVTVESTIQRSQNDRDLVSQSELDAKKEFLATMEMIFQELDTDDSSEMEIDELTDRIQDPTIAAYFSRIGVDVDQVQKLFTLLDQDKSGSVDKEEFMYGCLRLQGQAKSFDVAILQHDMKTIRKYIVALGESMGAWLDEHALVLQDVIDDPGAASLQTVTTPACSEATSGHPSRRAGSHARATPTLTDKEDVKKVLTDAKVVEKVLSDDESV